MMEEIIMIIIMHRPGPALCVHKPVNSLLLSFNLTNRAPHFDELELLRAAICEETTVIAWCTCTLRGGSYRTYMLWKTCVVQVHAGL